VQNAHMQKWPVAKEKHIIRPVESQFGARGNYGYSQGPCRLPHP